MMPESEPYSIVKKNGTLRRVVDGQQNFFQILERKFEEVNYYLIQLLSGRGYFRKYLFKMGKVTQSNCIYEPSMDGLIVRNSLAFIVSTVPVLLRTSAM